MARTGTAIANWIVGFLLAYVVVSRFRGRRAGLKAGLAWGSVSAVLSAIVYGRITDQLAVEIEEAKSTAEADARPAD